jgi:hypothetical protein
MVFSGDGTLKSKLYTEKRVENFNQSERPFGLRYISE